MFLQDQTEMVCRFLPDFTCVYVNDCLARKLNLAASKVQGKNLISIVPAKTVTVLNKAIKPLKPEKPFNSYEDHYINDKGETKWYRWSVRADFDESGHPSLIQIVARDITPEKHYQIQSQKHQQSLEKQLKIRTRELLEQVAERQQVEQNFEDLFDNASEIIFISDLNWRLISANQRGRELLGFSTDEKKGCLLLDIVLPKYHSRIRSHILKRFRGQSAPTVEFEALLPDGRIISLEMSSRIVYKNGQAVAVQGIARDITGRKAAEAAIRESEQRLLNIINFLPDSTFVIDKDGQVIAWNKAMEDMTGIGAKEMLGKGNYEYAIPFFGCARPMLIDLVLQPEAEAAGYYLLNKDQARLSVETFCPYIGAQGAYMYGTASPIYDSQGVIVGAIESIRDVTEQRKMENAVRDSEAKFRTLANTAPGLIFLAQDTKYLYVNPAFSKLLGYSEEELRELDVWDVIHPDHRDMVKYRSQARQAGKSVPERYEFKVVSKNGQVHWLDYCGNLIDYEGKPAIIAIATDITVAKELQEALRKSEMTFRQLADTAPALIFVLQNYKFRYFNSTFASVLAYEEKDLLRMHALDVVHPDFKSLVKYRLLELQYNNTEFRLDIKVVDDKGHEYWIDMCASMIEWEGLPAVIAVGYDISSHKRIQEALVQSESNFRQLADTAPTLIFVMRDSRLIYVNQTFENQTIYSRKECLGMNIWEFIHPDHREWIKYLSEQGRPESTSPGRYQAKLLRKDGSVAWGDFSTSEIIFNDQPAILGVGIDVSDRKQAEEQITYLSYHDKLTSLFNRAYAEEMLQKLDSEENFPLSFILGDVNGLKLVNDAFGHTHGDNLLKSAARILTTSCGGQGLVARWGGDEFVLLLPRCDENEALQLCSRISDACNAFPHFPVQISISLGLAVKRSAGQSIEEISKEAEDLMYRNKLLESRSNRSSFLYSLEKTLWVRSHETQAHTQRLRKLVTNIAEALNLQGEEMNSLNLLAALHDIGKIAVPNSILDKPDKLDPDEWELIKKHPETGYRIALSCPELAPIADAILSHHERWDGGGYPLGLRERDIPLMSRILAIADAYDVMLVGRPYKAPLSEEEVLNEIMRCAGTQFDPNLAALFNCLMRGQEIGTRMKDIF
ncbi:MAG: PAS domain S-box protein [Syntrophomonadaceae bacterium]